MNSKIENLLRLSCSISCWIIGIILIPIICTAEVIHSPIEPPEIEAPKIATPLQAKIGVFINDIYGFDLRNQSFNVVFWAWFVYPTSDNYKPEKSTEVVNAYAYTKNDSFAGVRKNNLSWSSLKFVGKVTHQWKVTNFPFDSQKLQIILEDMELDYSDLQYVVDQQNSKASPSIHLPDWKIVNFDLQVTPFVYPTTYGDPDVKSGDRTYARATVSISLERESTVKLFFNTFLALYVAFTLSALAFLIPINNNAPRLSLATGGVFAVVANKYALDTMLPLTTSITLVDKLQIFTLIFISISALTSVILIHLDSQHRESAKAVNKFVGILFLVSYIVFNVYWIFDAMKHT